ncbi:JK_59P [Escherichia phage Jk06]|uniref:JK_59P n=1 Tax=Escherichia phage Jk06 TaxID=2886922 RepID=Q45PV7_9CAUD|nr:hypothetical protein JK_59 [Escherichia phage Jk06]AAZ29309.1 JK_59P [Escherichia phage Jk06]
MTCSERGCTARLLMDSMFLLTVVLRSEIEPLLSNGVDVMIVRLHRDGFDFSGDSRSYLYNTGAIEVDLKLDSGDIDGSLNKLMEVVNSTFC